MQIHRVVREQAPADSGKHRTDDERQHLEARRVHAHRFGGDLVIANGDEGTAVAGIDQIVDRRPR